jgi:enamine deaminase RidA (YjgF/YER057c/UK114 family)
MQCWIEGLRKREQQPASRATKVVSESVPDDKNFELLRPAQLTTSVQYAYAAVVSPGRTVFTAGACPLDLEGQVVAPGDLKGQARAVMSNLEIALEAAGAQLTDVVKTTVFVASSNRGDLVRAWAIVKSAFGDHEPPSTLLGVAILGYPDQLVEVEAIAVLPAE